MYERHQDFAPDDIWLVIFVGNNYQRIKDNPAHYVDKALESEDFWHKIKLKKTQRLRTKTRIEEARDYVSRLRTEGLEDIKRDLVAQISDASFRVPGILSTTPQDAAHYIKLHSTKLGVQPSKTFILAEQEDFDTIFKILTQTCFCDAVNDARNKMLINYNNVPSHWASDIKFQYSIFVKECQDD